MSRVWVTIALLACTSPLSAGVYNFGERYPYYAPSKVRNLVLNVRSASLPDPKGGLKPEHFKSMILAETARLEALKREGLFTTLDRVSLSACYLRLGPDRAPDALRLLAAGDKDHFLVQSNLAAAYFLSGELPMAVRHQQRALTLWPEAFFAWDEGQLRRYRQCELALLRLYESRAQESRRGPVRENLDIDPVFPGVRYVGPSGQFEAGALTAEMSDRLPDNAVDLLTRLAVWFPTDMRLYWQLGQLLSVVGSIDQAAAIAEELTYAGMARSFKGLPQQRRALLDAMKSYKVILEPTEPAAHGQLVAAMMLLPRPLFAPPVVGAVAYAAGCAAMVPAVIESSNPPITPFDPPAGEPGPAAPVFNFRHVTIGFGFGFLVAALCGLQWQEWRRRRQILALANSSGWRPAPGENGKGSDDGSFKPAQESKVIPPPG
jgi:hypothetical protein